MELESGSGSGSYESGLEIDDNDKIDKNLKDLLFLIPLFLILLVVALLVLYECMYCPIKDWIKDIKTKYVLKMQEKKLPIYNNRITSSYIRELNKKNVTNIKNKHKSLECSICIAEINIENFKDNNTDLVFLNCIHVYHRTCLNKWVKTQAKKFITPNCPLCRTQIVENDNIKKHNSITYDSDSSDDYFDNL